MFFFCSGFLAILSLYFTSTKRPLIYRARHLPTCPNFSSSTFFLMLFIPTAPTLRRALFFFKQIETNRHSLSLPYLLVIFFLLLIIIVTPVYKNFKFVFPLSSKYERIVYLSTFPTFTTIRTYFFCYNTRSSHHF